MMGKKKQNSCGSWHLQHRALQNVHASMARMLDEGLYADLKIESQNDTTLAHRSVLASMSPILKTLLSAPEQTEAGASKILKLDDIVTTKALRGFLRLLYVGELDPKSIGWENGLEILAASHRYELPAITAICATVLGDMLTEKNCLRILEYADLYDANLSKRCKKFVAKHFNHVIQTDAFEELANRKPSILVDLVRSKIQCSASRKLLCKVFTCAGRFSWRCPI